MDVRKITEELEVLEKYQFKYSEDRVSDFINLFKTTNEITITAIGLPYPNNTKSTISKNGDVFTYKKFIRRRNGWVLGSSLNDNFEFTMNTQGVKTLFCNLFYSFRRATLLELLESSEKQPYHEDVATDYLKGQQLSLF